MPDEIRYLLFSLKEVLAAVAQLRLKRGEPLPRGGVCRAQLKGEPEIQLSLVAANERGERTPFEIGEQELGAALILYCIGQRIPLPTSGTKSLQVVGGGVALGICRGLTVQRLHELVRLD